MTILTNNPHCLAWWSPLCTGSIRRGIGAIQRRYLQNISRCKGKVHEVQSSCRDDIQKTQQKQSHFIGTRAQRPVTMGAKSRAVDSVRVTQWIKCPSPSATRILLYYAFSFTRTPSWEWGKGKFLRNKRTKHRVSKPETNVLLIDKIRCFPSSVWIESWR